MVKSKSILGENQNIIICVVIVVLGLFLIHIIIQKTSSKECFDNLLKNLPDCQKMDFWARDGMFQKSCQGIRKWGTTVDGTVDRDSLKDELKNHFDGSENEKMNDAEKCLRSCNI